jgi:HD-GYP domain-containing protein (c-di-GMP phosphodiesterase class II)
VAGQGRLVLCDVDCPAAVAAGAVLADTFEVQDWRSGHGAEGVILTSLPDRIALDDGVRVIGIIDGASGPWPSSWYALIPAGSPSAVVTRTVRNAFADLESVAERARLERELSELNTIGIQLSAERDMDVLLDTILTKACTITRSDGGSLYIVEEPMDGARHLQFALARNDSVPTTFRSARLPLDRVSVAGYVALTGSVVNLVDAYDPPPGSPFEINRSFDGQAAYRTKSMLVVPMLTPQGETIGAIQLINAKPEFDGPLLSVADVERHVRPFSDHDVRLTGSLASQAAVALTNRRMHDNITDLFEGFVKAAVTAIESRDPTTSGHSFRVATMTIALAKVVDRTSRGRFGDIRFTAEEFRELRYAALLHDFGKVGVREHVLVKAKKLYPFELERIRYRIDLLARDLELDVTRRKLALAVRHGHGLYAEHAARLDHELAAAITQLDDALDVILTTNEPTVHSQDVAGRLLVVAAQSWEDHRGQRRAVLTSEEASVLAITRGSLTDSERREIQQHVVHTYQFLAQIPWTRGLRRIPEIARAHHEKLDGSGYPFGTAHDGISIQARMMTIADIFDALTATDRPYKQAVRVDDALDMLRAEHRAGAIDGDLLDLFIEARVFTTPTDTDRRGLGG